MRKNVTKINPMRKQMLSLDYCPSFHAKLLIILISVHFLIIPKIIVSSTKNTQIPTRHEKYGKNQTFRSTILTAEIACFFTVFLHYVEEIRVVAKSQNITDRANREI